MGSEFCFKKLMFPFKDYGIVESGEAAFEVATFITGVPVESLREGRLRRTRGFPASIITFCVFNYLDPRRPI